MKLFDDVDMEVVISVERKIQKDYVAKVIDNEILDSFGKKRMKLTLEVEGRVWYCEPIDLEFKGKDGQIKPSFTLLNLLRLTGSNREISINKNGRETILDINDRIVGVIVQKKKAYRKTKINYETKQQVEFNDEEGVWIPDQTRDMVWKTYIYDFFDADTRILPNGMSVEDKVSGLKPLTHDKELTDEEIDLMIKQQLHRRGIQVTEQYKPYVSQINDNLENDLIGKSPFFFD